MATLEERLADQAKIPQEFEDELKALHNRMEQKTGNIYTLTVHKYGNPGNSTFVIGDIKSRNLKIEVKMNLPELEHLNGVYNNIDSAQEIFSNLGRKEMDDLYANRANWPKPNAMPKQIYCNLTISKGTPKIYTHAGGSLSICHNVGSYKFV